MVFVRLSAVYIYLLVTSELVAGHSAIVSATGDQGGAGSAIGIDPDTPRDGTRRRPFQQDSTRFRGDAADSCGETLAGGDNDIEAGTAQVMQLNGDTLPQVSPGGEIQMTVHQVNSDGAGPYTCMIDSTGTGTQWEPMQVTTNIEGSRRGRNRDTEATDLPLTAAIPADQTCTGTVAGQENVCMVRCENPARAGPFGGCVPVQMAGASGNGTENADAGQAAEDAANGVAANEDAANGDAANEDAADENTGNEEAAAEGAGGDDNEETASAERRSPRKLIDGIAVTDDDQEEEVTLVGGRRRFKA